MKNKVYFYALHGSIWDQDDALAAKMVRKISNPKDLEKGVFRSDASVPIHMAARFGMVQTVQALIKRNVSLDIITNSSGSAVEMIVGYDYNDEHELKRTTECARLLLAHGASLSRFGAYHRKSLLRQAVDQGMEELAVVILTCKINRDDYTGLGKTLLDQAVYYGCVQLTIKLIQAGADPEEIVGFAIKGNREGPETDIGKVGEENMGRLLDIYFQENNLLQIARSSIRNHLHEREIETGMGIRRRIKQLPLPQVMIEYLNFEQDFGSIPDGYKKYIPPTYLDPSFL